MLQAHGLTKSPIHDSLSALSKRRAQRLAKRLIIARDSSSRLRLIDESASESSVLDF